MATMRERDVEGLVFRLWRKGGRWLALGAVVLLLGFGVYTFMESRQRETESKAFADLYSIEKTYTERKNKFERSDMLKAQKAMNLELPTQDSKEDLEKTGDLQKDFGDVLTDLKSFLENHQGTQASAYAALLLSDIYADYEKWEESIPTLTEVSRHVGENSLFAGLLEMAMATSLAEADKCQEAVQHWNSLLAKAEFSFLHGEAALRSGLCLEKTGATDEAVEKYRLASQKAPPNSSLSSSASQFLRAIELRGSAAPQPVEETQ